MSITKQQAEAMQARVKGEKPRKSTKQNPKYKIHAKSRASCLIGIDPGTNTGLAIKESGLLRIVETGKIWWALNVVKEWAEYHGNQNTLVRFEDARLRKWFGNSGPEKWKGAGSIMRDCAIWEETLLELGIPFEKVAPKHVKETDSAYFHKITGWKGRTSIHAREAAWLIL